MKILILTQYFPPEVGAPQNRLYELAVRLQKKGVDVSILTAMPNYPKMEVHSEYRNKFYCYNEETQLKVHRAYIFVTKSRSILARLLNYFSFVFTSFFIGFFKLGQFDYILCESPPLFLGISAYGLKVFKGAKLIFNVSDLWPESAEKLGLVTNKHLLKWSTVLEEFLYRKSFLVTGQTQGIVKNIKDRFPLKTVYWLPNGVDVNYYRWDDTSPSSWRDEMLIGADEFVLIYAGIIGHAQGLEVIIKAAEILETYSKIKFVMLGSGPEKDRLVKLSNELNLNNILFIDSMPKNKMPDIIKSSDATIIPLKKLDLFKGAIPSKIFENLAMKKPIILGVEGEAKSLFIDQGKAGLFFEPENERALAESILKLYNNKPLLSELGNNGYEYVKEYFNRDTIAEEFYKQLS